MNFVRDYNTLPPLPGGPTNNNTPLPPIPVQRQQKYRPYDVALPGAGNYSSLNNATINSTTVARRPPMPLPVELFDVSPYENIGGRRLRKTTRRHRKTKHSRRLHKKKSKKSKKSKKRT